MTDLKKQSLRCLAHRFVSAQNAQIWTGPYLDGLKPTSAHIADLARQPQPANTTQRNNRSVA
jgi:hypothetical protein